MPSTLLAEPPLNPVHDIFHVDRIIKPDELAPRRRHKIIAVLPAYNAEKTLAATVADFPAGAWTRSFWSMTAARTTPSLSPARWG